MLGGVLLMLSHEILGTQKGKPQRRALPTVTEQSRIQTHPAFLRYAIAFVFLPNSLKQGQQGFQAKCT